MTKLNDLVYILNYYNIKYKPTHPLIGADVYKIYIKGQEKHYYFTKHCRFDGCLGALLFSLNGPSLPRW